MSKSTSPTYERLLQEWAFRREMVNYYCRALRLLTPDDPDAPERWRALSGKLAAAERAHRQASVQLRSYEQEQAQGSLVSP